MSLIFYDTETTGIDTRFDQILQFAAIKTDAELREIDRVEVRCRLLPHVVPSPGAMRVTRLRADQLIDLSYPSHYEMVRGLRAKLQQWSPGTFLGYNSLQFDEELFRQALYKTLHNPYLTNRDGNSRSDVMRMVHACNLFAPNALAIPLGDNGKPSFKLDRVAPANGFNHDRAHDAMGDVEATIHLCRLIAERAPDVWSSFMRFSQKPAVVDYISDEVVFCVSDSFFGNPHSCLVTVIGQNANNTNEWYVYDLGIDPATLVDLNEEQLAARLARSPKPVRRLRSNAVPILFPAEDAPAICKGREIGIEGLTARAETLRADGSFCQRLLSAFEATREGHEKSPHVEAQIYDGFPDRPDEVLMDLFHAVPWEERLPVVERFQDERLRIIGLNLIHVECPEHLSDEQCRELKIGIAERLLDSGEKLPWTSLPAALSEIDQLLASSSGDEYQFLSSHRMFLARRMNECQEAIAPKVSGTQ
jgi:exodeoxyribonuclease I